MVSEKIIFTSISKIVFKCCQADSGADIENSQKQNILS